jgi:hypothetical protein
VSAGAGQHEKEETDGGGALGEEGDDGEGGRWLYLRDGSGLSELLAREVNVRVKSAGGS